MSATFLVFLLCGQPVFVFLDTPENATKAAWMLPTPPVQAIARGRLPRPSQPCVARPARGASGGWLTIGEPVLGLRRMS